MKKIVLTGGGTAGHVTPNIALLPSLRQAGFDINYIGSYDGIEKILISNLGIPYYGISTGKLRRYFSAKNFTDPFRVIKGFVEAKKYLKEIKPDLVFSKGGFVTVPVIRAAASLGIPCIIHESDMTPGLANKICIPVATKICCNFPETIASLPKEKAVLTGSPIREELFLGDRTKGLSMCRFHTNKPILLVTGGSLGANAINQVIRAALPSLLEKYQIIHLCGKGKLDTSLSNIDGYKQVEYMNDELKDIFACSDFVISRAGANSICELLALAKPHILIPLPAASSRGDQLLNARSFEDQGFSLVLQEESLTKESLIHKLDLLYTHKNEYIETMQNSNQGDAISKILEIITYFI